MPLSVGEKLGPYEIPSLVGKGGMGVVYRARDSRLIRDFADQSLHRSVQQRCGFGHYLATTYKDTTPIPIDTQGCL